MSIGEEAKFTKEQKTQRSFSPLSNGDNNAYLLACGDRRQYLGKPGVRQSPSACSVNTRLSGFPEMLARQDMGQGLSHGRGVIPELMGAQRAQQMWAEINLRSGVEFWRSLVRIEAMPTSVCREV